MVFLLGFLSSHVALPVALSTFPVELSTFPIALPAFHVALFRDIARGLSIYFSVIGALGYLDEVDLVTRILT